MKPRLQACSQKWRGRVEQKDEKFSLGQLEMRDQLTRECWCGEVELGVVVVEVIQKAAGLDELAQEYDVEK